jgi:hypothetical protein
MLQSTVVASGSSRLQGCSGARKVTARASVPGCRHERSGVAGWFEMGRGRFGRHLSREERDALPLELPARTAVSTRALVPGDRNRYASRDRTANRWWRYDRGCHEGRRHDCLPLLGEESGQGTGVGRAASPRCSPWWSRFFSSVQVLLVFRLAASERRSIVLLRRRSTAPRITAAFQGSARNRWRAGSPPRTRAGRLSMLGSGTRPGSRWSGDRKSFRRRSG